MIGWDFMVFKQVKIQFIDIVIKKDLVLFVQVVISREEDYVYIIFFEFGQFKFLFFIFFGKECVWSLNKNICIIISIWFIVIGVLVFYIGEYSEGIFNYFM